MLALYKSIVRPESQQGRYTLVRIFYDSSYAHLLFKESAPNAARMCSAESHFEFQWDINRLSLSGISSFLSLNPSRLFPCAFLLSYISEFYGKKGTHTHIYTQSSERAKDRSEGAGRCAAPKVNPFPHCRVAL